jgi:hypothetical protein
MAFQRNCRDRDREELPEQDVVMHADGKRLERDIAEGMVEEMADQIGKQHQSADKANLADADAAYEFLESGSRAFGHAFPGIWTAGTSL